jgi:quercetin dioxygenase-like cupin family protein
MFSAPCLRARGIEAAVLVGVLAAGLLGRSDHALTREEVTTLLDTTKTITGQTLSYPTGAPAKVSAAIITMQPGEERGWHKHDVPLVGYILDGELTIDFGPLGTRVFRKGEAFVEAVNTSHNGRNLGKSEVRILAVFLGAEGVPDTVPMPPPQ